MVWGARVRWLAAIWLTACGWPRRVEHDIPEGGAPLVWVPTAAAPGAPRAGMAWIPAGVLHAGSETDEVPRIAEAELPGVDVPMTGFYVDVWPWPNEPGAIPTSDVTRGEAKRLCEERGKRLCSELEWERACKGPNNLRFEYGPTFDARACGVGVAPEAAAQRPSGQRTTCRSTFGVRDMHGGPSEWTDSRWGRGSTKDLGVVRGGNDVDGELETRCAFARSLAPTERAASVGFRCCAGPRNEGEVQLDVKQGVPFERSQSPMHPSPPLAALSGVACGPPPSPAPCSFARAWTWRPTPNVELSLSGGCVGHDPTAHCAFAVSRATGGRIETLAEIDTGREIPEVVLVAGPDRRLRIRGLETRGHFFREVVFTNGRLDVRAVH